MAYIPNATEIGVNAFDECNNLSIVVLHDSFFDDQDETVDAKKIRMGIREEAQCVRYSDYIKSSVEEINGVIGEKRFNENHNENDEDKISRLLLFKRMRDGLDPRGLSKDENETLKSKNSESDVYKVVKSIDDYEHKKEWAKYLGVKVNTSEVEEPRQGTGEDEVNESVKRIREQLNALDLDNKLEEKISECNMHVNQFLAHKDMENLKIIEKDEKDEKEEKDGQAEEEEKQETEKSGGLTISSGRINIGTASGQVLRSICQTDKYSDRQKKLDDFRTRLNELVKEDKPKDELRDIARSVGSLFEEMKRTSTRSTKTGMNS